jgi:hypothetical protein
MAALQVPIIVIWAVVQGDGCTKYVSWVETQHKLVFEFYFNAIVIGLTGVLIAGALRIYRVSFKETYVRILGGCFLLWALLTTIGGIWSISDCGAGHDPEHMVYFAWIGPYLAQPVIWLKIALVLGTAYRILDTRFRAHE